MFLSSVEETFGELEQQYADLPATTLRMKPPTPKLPGGGGGDGGRAGGGGGQKPATVPSTGGHCCWRTMLNLAEFAPF